MVLLLMAVSIFSTANNQITSFELVTTQNIQYGKAIFKATMDASIVNPYDANEVSLDMMLTSPSDLQIVVPAFYCHDEENWKVHFSPRESGEYGYHFQLKKDGEVVDNSASDLFEVASSDETGFLKTNNDWTFKFDNGELFRGIGINVGWEGRSWDNPAESFTYEHYLSRLSEDGANFIRTWMSQWNLPLEWQRVSNTNRYQNSTTYFHHEAIDRMDQFVDLCQEKDIYVMLCLEVHGSIQGGEWDDSPYNAANGGPCNTRQEFFTSVEAREQFKNRLRYLVARWGYSPHIAMWELFNEIDNVSAPLNIPDHVITNWHTEMSAYLKAVDPYGRMVTTSISHRDINGLNAIASIDINQKHIYHDNGDATDVISAINQYTNAHHKPYIIGECGWTWDWNKDFSNPSTVENLIFDFKRALWYGAFSSTPVYPMNWWWEFFDTHDVYYFYEGIRYITAEMLKDGEGAFEPLSSTSANLDTYTVKCGSTIYVYVLNRGFTGRNDQISIASLVPDKSYYLQAFNTESGAASNKGTVLSNGAGQIGLTEVSIPARQGMVYILSEQERSERDAQNDFDELFIPAESFSNSSGVSVDVGTDEDAGQMVTNIEDGTWLSYSHINIPETGNYIVEYRVASLNGGLLQIEEGGNPDNAYGSLPIPPTGGDAVWVTVSNEVTLQSGIQNFGIKALEGGWNFNWFRFIPEQSTFLRSLKGNDFDFGAIVAQSRNEEISFFASTPAPERVKVSVFNLEGQRVVGPKWIEISTGRHVLRSGKALLPGVYLLSLHFEKKGLLAEKFLVK